MCGCAGYAALFFSGVALGGHLFPPAARSAAAWARAAAALAAASAAAWLATAALDHMVKNFPPPPPPYCCPYPCPYCTLLSHRPAAAPPRRPAPASGGDRAKGAASPDSPWLIGCDSRGAGRARGRGAGRRGEPAAGEPLIRALDRGLQRLRASCLRPRRSPPALCRCARPRRPPPPPRDSVGADGVVFDAAPAAASFMEAVRGGDGGARGGRDGRGGAAACGGVRGATARQRPPPPPPPLPTVAPTRVPTVHPLRPSLPR